MTAFIILSVFIVAVLAVYQIYDSRRHKRMEQELNQSRYRPSRLHERPKNKHQTAVITEKDLPDLSNIPPAYKFCGELDPLKRYKNGDIVTVKDRFFLYVGGRFEYLDLADI